MITLSKNKVNTQFKELNKKKLITVLGELDSTGHVVDTYEIPTAWLTSETNMSVKVDRQIFTKV